MTRLNEWRTGQRVVVLIGMGRTETSATIEDGENRVLLGLMLDDGTRIWRYRTEIFDLFSNGTRP